MEELLNYLNNYFYSYALMTNVTFEEDGASFTISKLERGFYKGQYINIDEIIINDGIFKITSIRDNGDSITVTTDSTEFAEGNFRGLILALAVPRPVIKLKEAIEKTGATTARDMGKVMQEVRPKTAGKADGKLVSDLVKKLL